MATDIGMMDGAYFVGRSEILTWINNRLQLNLSRIEEVLSFSIPSFQYWKGWLFSAWMLHIWAFNFACERVILFSRREFEDGPPLFWLVSFTVTEA